MNMKNENKTTAALSAIPADDCFGFYGTVRDALDSESRAAALWSEAIALASEKFGPVLGRNLLRSRSGRHIADGVVGCSEDLAEVLDRKWVKRAARELESAGYAAELFDCDQI